MYECVMTAPSCVTTRGAPQIPKDMHRVLHAAREYDDGLGGRWETIVIKHTVI